jgi:hypothetical protein
VLDEVLKNVSERISELKSWIKMYKDEQKRCNALVVLGENQYWFAILEELRKGGE